MDWHAVFEDPERGLISLIGKAQTSEVLRQVTVVVIEKLFSRRNDGANRGKYLKQVHAILPEEATDEQMEALREGATKLLRSVRDDRKDKAAAYLAAKEEANEAGRRITDKLPFPGLRRKLRKLFAPLKRPVIAIPGLVVLILIGSGYWFVFFPSPDRSKARSAMTLADGCGPMCLSIHPSRPPNWSPSQPGRTGSSTWSI